MKQSIISKIKITNQLCKNISKTPLQNN